MAVFEFTGDCVDITVTEASEEGDGVSEAIIEIVSSADADFDASNDRCAELERVTVAVWEDECDEVEGADKETELDVVDEAEGAWDKVVEGVTDVVVCWESEGVCEIDDVPDDEAETESVGDSEVVDVGQAEMDVHRVANADVDEVAEATMEEVTVGVVRGDRELDCRGLRVRSPLSDRETRGDALVLLLSDDSADSDASAVNVSAAEPVDVDERENTVAEELTVFAAVESPDSVALTDGESVGDDDNERDAHALADDEGDSRDDADRDSVGDDERDSLGEELAEEDPLTVVVRVPKGVRDESSIDDVGLVVVVVVRAAERVGLAAVADVVTVPGSDLIDVGDEVTSAVLVTEPERCGLCVSVGVALTVAPALNDMLADGERDVDEVDDADTATDAELEREAHDADTLTLAVTDGDDEMLFDGAPEALCVGLLGTESVTRDVADTDCEMIGEMETIGVEDTQAVGRLLTLSVLDDWEDAVDDGEPVCERLPDVVTVDVVVVEGDRERRDDTDAARDDDPDDVAEREVCPVAVISLPLGDAEDEAEPDAELLPDGLLLSKPEADTLPETDGDALDSIVAERLRSGEGEFDGVDEEEGLLAADDEPLLEVLGLLEDEACALADFAGDDDAREGDDVRDVWPLGDSGDLEGEPERVGCIVLEPEDRCENVGDDEVLADVEGVHEAMGMCRPCVGHDAVQGHAIGVIERSGQ